MADLLQRLDDLHDHYPTSGQLGPGNERIFVEAATEIVNLRAKLRDSHQNCLAMWEALEGGPSPMCRDCADFNGRCQGNGPACEPQERAMERIKHLRTSVERASARPREFYAWAAEMFGPVAKLRSERLMRFVEEAIELAHADEMERSVLDAIANRVYGREPGQITKEIGQAQATLEMYAENIGESSALLAEIEWHRVREIPRAEWERRHAAKAAIGIAHPSTELQP
jgi:hypothetical protein